MLDEILLNTRFARWVAGKIINKSIKDKYGVDTNVIVKKFVVRSDEKISAIDADIKIVAKRENAEQIIRQILEEEP